jgi:aldehyde:ferredoxin oxidoreductase
MLTDYKCRILWVDLNQNIIQSKELDGESTRKFIGGSGIASKIVWDETIATTEPLSPENPLIFMTGPLTGTSAPMNSRITITSLSPLTGIWGEAHSGGSWPDELKRSGYDGVIIKGKAKEPVYLRINNQEVTLVNANHLWGKDTWETDDILKRETDPRAITLTIGQAGEKLVRVACLISGGRSEARAAARCGLGAVMGSKNLKAIVVRGTLRPIINHPEELKKSVEKNWGSKITQYDPRRRNEIYGQFLRELYASGKDPINNFREGNHEVFAEKFAVEIQRGEPLFCRGCRTSCIESAKIGDMRRTMKGAMDSLGLYCLIDDVEAINAAYHLCNQFGIDYKSTGAIIAFAMECYEKGLITKTDTEGIDLAWGNGEAMVEMVRRIGLRERFGEVLGEGVRKAAEIIGGNACEYAIHSKGLEFPNWDPRSSNFRALGQATGNIGADPYTSLGVLVRHSAVPELGIFKADIDEHRFVVEGKGEAVANTQNFGVLINSMGICLFSVFLWMPQGQHTAPSSYLEWLNHVTGWNMDLKEFIKCGERIFNLQRMINVRRGISRKDDMLPGRFLTERLHSGPHAGHVPPLGEMLGDYYFCRGWNEEGIPSKEKLVELGLEETIESRRRVDFNHWKQSVSQG